jgi:hypothetical protein
VWVLTSAGVGLQRLEREGSPLLGCASKNAPAGRGKIMQLGDLGICASTGRVWCGGSGNAAKSLSVRSVGRLGPCDWPPRVGRGKSAPMSREGGKSRREKFMSEERDEIGHVIPLA